MKLNLPNKLSLTRIGLTILIIFILLFPFDLINVRFPVFDVRGVELDSRLMVAGVLFIIASITDFLDGHIARKHNLITDFGKTVDAIADKTLVSSSLIILSGLGLVNPLVPAIIVFRDVVVDAIKMQSAAKGKVVAAIKSGKIKTVTQMIGTTLVFFSNIPFAFFNLRVAEFLLYVAVVLAIWSMIEYYQLNKDIIFDKENS